eukprot:111086_1
MEKVSVEKSELPPGPLNFGGRQRSYEVRPLRTEKGFRIEVVEVISADAIPPPPALVRQQSSLDEFYGFDRLLQFEGENHDPHVCQIDEVDRIDEQLSLEEDQKEDQIPKVRAQLPDQFPGVPKQIQLGAPAMLAAVPRIPAPVPAMHLPEPEIPDQVPEIPDQAPVIHLLEPEIQVQAPVRHIPEPDIPDQVPLIPIPEPEIQVQAPVRHIPEPDIQVQAPVMPRPPAPEIPVQAPVPYIDEPAIQVQAPVMPVEAPEIQVQAPAPYCSESKTESREFTEITTGPNESEEPQLNPILEPLDRSLLRVSRKQARVKVQEFSDTVAENLDEFPSFKLLEIYGSVSIASETLDMWQNYFGQTYNTKGGLESPLRTVVEYAENGEPVRGTKNKLRFITFQLCSPDCEFDSAGLLVLLAYHGGVCHVQKEVGISMAYSLMTGTIRGEMDRQSMGHQVAQLLHKLKQLLIESMFLSEGRAMNTHPLLAYQNGLAPYIGLDRVPDQHQQPEAAGPDRVNKFFQFYSVEALIDVISLAINDTPRKIPYDTIISWLESHCPPGTDKYEFMSRAFDTDSGHLTESAVVAILLSEGVLRVGDEAGVDYSGAEFMGGVDLSKSGDIAPLGKPVKQRNDNLVDRLADRFPDRARKIKPGRPLPLPPDNLRGPVRKPHPRRRPEPDMVLQNLHPVPNILPDFALQEPIKPGFPPEPDNMVHGPVPDLLPDPDMLHGPIEPFFPHEPDMLHGPIPDLIPPFLPPFPEPDMIKPDKIPPHPDMVLQGPIKPDVPPPQPDMVLQGPIKPDVPPPQPDMVLQG